MNGLTPLHLPDGSGGESPHGAAAPGRRPRILVSLGRYVPGVKAGGPVRSIENMVEALGDEFEFFILALDRDLGDERPYPDIVPDVWQRVGKAQVIYLSPQNSGLPAFGRLLRQTPCDLLYLNSFFDVRWTVLPLLLRRLGYVPPVPVILAPRGQFSPGALALGRPKKAAFLRLLKTLGLLKGVLYHATAESEREDIERTLDGPGSPVSIEVAHNLASPLRALNPQAEVPKKAGTLRAVFLSRISPKKNLDGALSMLASVRGEVRFDIYGPTEDEAYWARCREKIEALPPHVKVEYGGPLSREQVYEAFARSDLFFFPTHGENFGHAIQEALAAGCPVLLSDQTPWRGLEAAGVGWDLPLSAPERFTAALQACIEMGPEPYAAMRERAREYARKAGESQDAVREHREMFRKALSVRAPSGRRVAQQG